MVYFWIIVVVVGMGSHLISSASNFFAKKRHSISYGNLIGDSCMWLRGSIETPATFGYRCAQKAGWGTVPPRIQSLTVLAFIIINVAVTVHGYRFFKGNI